MNAILRFSAIIAVAIAAADDVMLPEVVPPVAAEAAPAAASPITVEQTAVGYKAAGEFKAIEGVADPFMVPITAGTNLLTAGMNAVIAAGTVPLNVLGSIPSKAVSALNGIFGGVVPTQPNGPGAARRRLHYHKNRGGGGYNSYRPVTYTVAYPVAYPASQPIYTTYYRPYLVAPTYTTTSPVSTFLEPYYF